MVGAALTLFTVKLVFVLRPTPSVTVRVIVVKPLYARTGVTLMEHLPCASGPVSAMPSAWISAELL